MKSKARSVSTTREAFLAMVGAMLLVACSHSTPSTSDARSRSEQDHVTAPKWSLLESAPEESGSNRESGREHHGDVGEERNPERSLFVSSVPVWVAPDLLSLARTVESDEALARKASATWKQDRLDPLVKERFPTVRPVEGGFFVRSLEEKSDRRAPQEADLGESFVIDYSEPSVVSLLEEFEPQTANPRKWEKTVSSAIQEKTYTRGFDIASQVAQFRAGDCTEHAVLLTALLRASDVPARVTLGVVVVIFDGGVMAGGHAWTEYFDGQEWRRLDAALYQPSQVSIASAGDSAQGRIFGVADAGSDSDAPPAVIRRLYIPRFHLENEGTGYATALVPVLSGSLSRVRLTLRDP